MKAEVSYTGYVNGIYIQGANGVYNIGIIPPTPSQYLDYRLGSRRKHKRVYSRIGDKRGLEVCDRDPHK